LCEFGRVQLNLPSTMQGLDCVCFTLIVDDIVFPDGSTCMLQLGGGGPQTLFGFQLVNAQQSKVGLAAGVGADMPPECTAWLSSIGVDTSGLLLHPRSTPRAWQVFEADGRRTQVWRGKGDPCDELYDMLRPKFDTMPPHFKIARNFHIGVHPLYPPLRLLRKLREVAHEAGGVLSVEPYTAAEQPATREQVEALLKVCDIFSPNEGEAASMVGQASPLDTADMLLDAAGAGGASVVVVRRGEHGVLVKGRSGRAAGGGSGAPGAGGGAAGEAGGSRQQAAGAWEAWEVPAVADTRAVDVTGCGNAFCGGFLAAYDRTKGNLLESALHGCVAASFMAEERGVPKLPIPGLQGRAQQRMEELRKRAVAVSGQPRKASVSVTACLANVMIRRAGRQAVAGCRKPHSHGMQARCIASFRAW